MKASVLATANVVLISALNLSVAFPAAAQDFTDMLGQEQIDRGTMDRNRRSRGQNKTLWETSEGDSNSNVTYAVRRAKIITEARGVNVRKGPGLNYDVVTQVFPGMYVGAIGNSADGKWTQLKCADCPPNGEIWIFSAFL